MFKLENKVVDWVESAVLCDKFIPVSDAVNYSSSIIDMFTSFQQVLDFLKTLEWPDRLEVERFNFELIFNIIDAITRYTFVILDKAVVELQSTKNISSPSTREVKKFKIPKFKKKKSKKPVNIVSVAKTRLSSKALNINL